MKQEKSTSDYAEIISNFLVPTVQRIVNEEIKILENDLFAAIKIRHSQRKEAFDYQEFHLKKEIANKIIGGFKSSFARRIYEIIDKNEVVKEIERQIDLLDLPKAMPAKYKIFRFLRII